MASVEFVWSTEFLKIIWIFFFIFPFIGLLRGHAWESFSLSLKFLLFLTMSFLLYFSEACLKCILTQNELIFTKVFREWKSQGILHFLKNLKKDHTWCKPWLKILHFWGILLRSEVRKPRAKNKYFWIQTDDFFNKGKLSFDLSDSKK